MSVEAGKRDVQNSSCTTLARRLLASLANVSIAVAGRRICGGVNLEITAGSVLLLQGGNGAGKTTLLRTVAGIHRSYTGEISRAPGVSIGFASGTVSMLYEDLSLRENLALVSRRVFEPKIIAADLASRPLKELSSGERALAGFERVCALEPDVILLDEITAHMDERKRAAVLAWVRQCATAGHAVIIVSHESPARELFDAVYTLNSDGLIRQVYN